MVLAPNSNVTFCNPNSIVFFFFIETTDDRPLTTKTWRLKPWSVVHRPWSLVGHLLNGCTSMPIVKLLEVNSCYVVFLMKNYFRMKNLLLFLFFVRAGFCFNGFGLKIKRGGNDGVKQHPWNTKKHPLEFNTSEVTAMNAYFEIQNAFADA